MERLKYIGKLIFFIFAGMITFNFLGTIVGMAIGGSMFCLMTDISFEEYIRSPLCENIAYTFMAIGTLFGLVIGILVSNK